MNTIAANPRTAAMAEGRRADTARRSQRVIKALNDAATRSEDLSVTAIARTAGVDRTFLYRHRDLLGQVHAMAAQPATGTATNSPSRASLQADLLAAQQRTVRLHTRVRQLEQRLSQLLGAGSVVTCTDGRQRTVCDGSCNWRVEVRVGVAAQEPALRGLAAPSFGLLHHLVHTCR